jgi:hypothetical protein
MKEDEFKIFEHGSPKMATITLCRWALFVEFFDEIDQSEAKLVVDGQQEVNSSFTAAPVGTRVSPPDIVASIFESFTF